MQQVELWMVIPFAIMLLTIAIAPLVMEHKWEKNRNKFIFTMIISVATTILLSCYGMGGAVWHNILFDYIPFVMLLLALFVVTGGIHISGDITATPLVNTFILGMGFAMASVMGTTGCSFALYCRLTSSAYTRCIPCYSSLLWLPTAVVY